MLFVVCCLLFVVCFLLVVCLVFVWFFCNSDSELHGSTKNQKIRPEDTTGGAARLVGTKLAATILRGRGAHFGRTRGFSLRRFAHLETSVSFGSLLILERAFHVRELHFGHECAPLPPNFLVFGLDPCRLLNHLKSPRNHQNPPIESLLQ